jgi:hypothetical protein
MLEDAPDILADVSRYDEDARQPGQYLCDVMRTVRPITDIDPGRDNVQNCSNENDYESEKRGHCQQARIRPSPVTNRCAPMKTTRPRMRTASSTRTMEEAIAATEASGRELCWARRTRAPLQRRPKDRALISVSVEAVVEACANDAAGKIDLRVHRHRGYWNARGVCQVQR